jgi:hypothetical protein
LRAEAAAARAAASETILTHIVTEGTIALDSPGIALAVADIYDGM